MDKIKAYFRRHKEVTCMCFLWISVFIFAVGATNYIGMYSQTKININQMTEEDFSEMKISTIGNITASKIVKAQPIVEINDLTKINGIGNERYSMLSKVFCTYDNCRFTDYITILIWDALLIAIGALCMIYFGYKHKGIKEQKAKNHEKVIHFIDNIKMPK